MTKDFATCDLCDAYKNDTSGDFRVLAPVFRDFGAVKKFSGPVQTVKCFEDNSLVKAAVDSPGYLETPEGRVGKVLVVDGGASMRRALLGGNLGAAAARNGWAGVVIDGCVRDTAELVHWLPCRCRRKSATKGKPRLRCKYRVSGCDPVTGCMPMKTAWGGPLRRWCNGSPGG